MSAESAAARRLHVIVVYADAPRRVVELEIELPAGARLQDAIDSPIVRAAFSTADFSLGKVGVWGRKLSLQHVLRDGDRVELYRPLMVDPKVARRERFASQGARATGLFAKKRAGAKAGY